MKGSVDFKTGSKVDILLLLWIDIKGKNLSSGGSYSEMNKIYQVHEGGIHCSNQIKRGGDTFKQINT